MNLCVETFSLSHGYNRHEQVVKELHLAVPKGSIYGFLGPNGAGKTTTLKMLLGLIVPTSGQVNILGRDLKQHRVEILARTGSLIESPSIYGHLSAVENLKVWKGLFNAPDARITETLELVGLANTGKKKAGQFSLGMKQRLAIAAALLHQPELLILDEPTNGLDPQGIIEMRDLLRRLNEESGVTIIISSHLLAEVEKLVTHLGIIHLGQMRFQGTWNELQSMQRNQQAVIWRTSDNSKAQSIIQQGEMNELGVRAPWMDDKAIAQINRALYMADIDIYEVRQQVPDLENTFLQMIQ